MRTINFCLILSVLLVILSGSTVKRISFVEDLSSWWPASAIAASLAVPGAVPDNLYNYVIMNYWQPDGSDSAVSIWENPVGQMQTTSEFGSTNEEIRRNIKGRFADKGIKLLVSAFGDHKAPTWMNATETAISLASFVKNNFFDGANVDYHDYTAFINGKATNWLIDFTRTLRNQLGNQYIITHSPNADYFQANSAFHQGYLPVHQQVGDLIDFYIIKYYNNKSPDNTFQGIFINSGSSKIAVSQIISKGISKDKIVVAKSLDIYRHQIGYVSPKQIGNFMLQAYQDPTIQFYTGLAIFQFKNDLNGTFVQMAIRKVIQASQPVIGDTQSQARPQLETTQQPQTTPQPPTIPQPQTQPQPEITQPEAPLPVTTPQPETTPQHQITPQPQTTQQSQITPQPQTPPQPQTTPQPQTAPQPQTLPLPVTTPLPVTPPQPQTTPLPVTTPQPQTTPLPVTTPLPITPPQPQTTPLPVTTPQPQNTPLPVTTPLPITPPQPQTTPLPVTTPQPQTMQPEVQQQPPTPSVKDMIRFTYISRVQQTSTDPKVKAASLGVPGYAPDHLYNYIALTFWTYTQVWDTTGVWQDPINNYGPNSGFGSTTAEFQTFLLDKYHSKGIKLLASAFGATDNPTSQGQDPTAVAIKFAKFIKDNKFDGADVDYQDSDAFKAGTAQKWLITFTRVLKNNLQPRHIITHSPQGPHFKASAYPQGGYLKIHKQVGDLIDFYNVQFYNQEATTYDTYTTLFEQSNGWFPGTSVMEIVNSGVPMSKIVVGKPALQADVFNTGYVNPNALSSILLQAKQKHNFTTGVMFWQYYSDHNGSIIQTSMSKVLDIPLMITQPINIPISSTLNGTSLTIPINVIPSVAIPTNSAPSTTAPTNSTPVPSISSAPIIDLTASTKVIITKPIVFTYVDQLTSWWPAEQIASGMGVPGLALQTAYNYFSFTNWLPTGASNIAAVWKNSAQYLGTTSQFGATDQQIRDSLKQKYHEKGIKILVSAFSDGGQITNTDPITTAQDLAKFVIENKLDGVDVFFSQGMALKEQKAADWLIPFTAKLRKELNNAGDYIITHSIQAPFFKDQNYNGKGYTYIHNQIGHMIDFYNIQFFNQVNTKYNTYEGLFKQSEGDLSLTSVDQLKSRGIPLTKIVVGKPAIQTDAAAGGFVTSSNLSSFVKQARNQLGFRTGVMVWHYFHDKNGTFVNPVLNQLQ